VIQLDPRTRGRTTNWPDLPAHGMIREGYGEVRKTVELDPNMTDARIQLGQIYLMAEIGNRPGSSGDGVSEGQHAFFAHLILSACISRRKTCRRPSRRARRPGGERKLEAYLQLASLRS